MKIRTSSQAVRDRHGSRGTTAPGRTCASPPRSSKAHVTATTQRGGRERDQGASPPPEDGCERHGDRRRDGGAELDSRRVDACPRRRALGHGLPDGERRRRVADAHADPERQSERDHEPRARDHAAQDPEHADQHEADRHREPRAEPRREGRTDRREHPHAEHGDRSEEPRDRVRRVEVVLDLPDQRPDADHLRAQRERREEEPRQRSRGGARRQEAAAFDSWRPLAIRANASTCRRAARPAAPGFPERIASSSGAWSSAASSGSMDVP